VRFFETSRPLVFAHRGGCALAPENTLAAFDAGMAAGADGLELDVHLAADGRVVVHHDSTLERTTNGSGPVAALTSAELARLDASCRFVPETELAGGPASRTALDPALAGVPTLREVLERYRAARVIVEMKVDTAAMGRAVLEDVRAAGAADRVCAAGMGWRSIQAVRQGLPAVATSACGAEVRLALYRSWARWPVRHVGYGGYQVPEHAGRLRVVSPRFIRDSHAAGLAVQVWTVDDEDDMVRLLDWGADALISNRPDLAVRTRDAFLARR
jgi:glycerophosphoryl diester phosphodiesterase